MSKDGNLIENASSTTNAALCLPIGAGLDRAGNLYIADSRNGIIRKVTFANFTGTIQNGALIIPDAQPDIAGRYQLIVSNPYGSITSSIVTLTVQTAVKGAPQSFRTGLKPIFDPGTFSPGNPGSATPLVGKPVITVQPTNQTVINGTNVTFSVTATGGVLNYQWWFNGTNVLAGQRNSTLTLTNVTTTNAGAYFVVVTNSAGSATSSNAMLTVLTPPLITTQPTSQSAVQGANVTFTVNASGSLLNYQWWFNGTNKLAGQTNSTTVLTNVQSANAGSYIVVVSNLIGTLNSSNAVLTVNPPPPCDQPPVGLVSWWPGNNNAQDVVGVNNGAWVGTAGYTNGEVGQAFSVRTNNYVSIPDSASLDQFTTNLTIEFWTKGSGPIDNWFSMVSKTDNGYEIRLNDHTNTASFVINGLTPGNLVGTRNIHDGNWHHIAGVYDGTNMYLYVDGNLDTQQTNTGTINCAVGTPLDIGTAADWVAARAYTGLIDEVSIYNNAISSNQIAAIYSAGASGKCPPSPPVIVTQPANVEVPLGSNAIFSVTATGWAPLSYQWTFNGTNLFGATNPILALTGVQLNQAGSYAVLIMNVAGSAISSNAFLIVDSQLGNWRFDITNIVATNAWIGDQGQLPLVATNVVGVPSWDTNAVLIDSTNPAILSYHVVETNGNQNISLSYGTVSFWFRPDWTSSNSFGNGPGTNGQLIEIGNYIPLLNTNTGLYSATNGCWSMFLTPDGNQLIFGSSTNGGFQINLDAATSFTSNQWCQIVLTYTSTNSLLYLNSQLLTNGLGPIYYPGPIDQSGGFRIGSDSSGNSQTRGVFEDLATYDYPLSATNIATIYQNAINMDSGGDGLSNILANELGLNPYVYNSLYGLSSTNGLQVFTPLR